MLALAWILYDVLCRLLGARQLLLAIALLAFVAAAAYGVSNLFSARAVPIQLGAMLGTMMAGNVLFVIIPGQRELVRAKQAGREPDPAHGIRGKQRSVHNNYLTLPVVLAMIAPHFPFLYTHERAWLVLLTLMVLGAWIRLFFNLRHQGRTIWTIPATAAVALFALAVAIRPEDGSSRRRRRPGSIRTGRRGRRAALRDVSFRSADGRIVLDGSQGRGPRYPGADQGPGGRDRGAGGGDEGDAARERDRDDRRRAGVARAVDRPGRGNPLESRRMLEIVVAAMRFSARLEEEAAPQSVAAFRRLLPLQSRVIHARWSGEATWIPFGDLEVGVGPENATCYPAPGELLLYPGGVSETEILFPYGAASFASKAGPLAGNHFATIVEGGEQLRELGKLVLWEGAQDIAFDET